MSSRTSSPKNGMLANEEEMEWTRPSRDAKRRISDDKEAADREREAP